MLILNKSDIIGEGNSRIVYQHPNEFKKVIKIEKKYFEIQQFEMFMTQKLFIFKNNQE